MSWVREQIIYQIFPERFAIGRPHTSATKLALPVYQQPKYTRHDWGEVPPQPPRGRDFFGGDLQGILDRLDYVQNLGATALYLTPIFLAPSNHKYDTTDFYTIDPMFGGEATLRTLTGELHRRGLKLILDAVFNHVSDCHPWRQTHPEYFTGTYWRDFRHMPELDLDNRDLRDDLFRVLQKYLDLGVDGWRFDVAVDLGLPFVRDLRARFPTTMLLGEVMSYARDWCGPDLFTGVMNYYFRDALLGWLRGEFTTSQLRAVVGDVHAGSLDSWNMLSSHDTPRLRHTLPDPALRRLAIVAQFTLPGAPLIYYGEEIGMDGGPDPDCRRPMIWDEQRWDHETRQFYRQLIALRQSRPEFQHGHILPLESDALVFLRYTDQPTEVALVALNRSNQPLNQIVLTPHSHLYHALPMKNVLAPDPIIPMEAGNLRLSLPPRSAAIFVPDDTRLTTYRFHKPRNFPCSQP